MRATTLVCALGLAYFGAASAEAQAQSGNIAALEFQTPKNGMSKQYEEGRKQKAAWHKQQNDKTPLYVWEIRSGDNTGTFVVGQLGQHWADFDKPSVPEAADLEEYNKVIGAYVQSLVTRYYEFLPKISNAASASGPSKFAEIITFEVRPGHGQDFRSAIERVTEAAQKTKWPVNYEWYVLANGGRNGTYVLVLPRASWSDFEDKPGTKPFPEMVKDAFGQAEADSIVKRLDSSIEAERSEIIEFRPDLSYVPSK